MAAGEQIVDDIGRLEERAHELAMEAGKKAADLATGLLGRHQDVIDPALATLIEAEEFDRSFEAALVARESGHLNDNFNREPGITIFMTAAALEEAKENSELNSSGYMAEYLETVEPMDEEGRVYALRLPEGGYYMSMGCTFYGEATAASLPLDGEKPFQFPTNAIVRVESDSGDLWQNANYQPDGTPIERQ